ncbi:MAG TPA: hypothetical protein VMP13_09530 [Acidimicrobiia bacterium]|nr:hypothetical protein [Acidimicrobiia bacterium]
MRTQWKLVMVAMALVALASCDGGSDDASVTIEAGDDSAAAQDEGDSGGAATEEPADQDVSGSAEEQAGERSAVITIDGVATRYALDDVEYSPVEGVSDITFERCDPSFFGSGRFYAIGYAVDDSGDLLIDADGDLAGFFTMDLPPDDWEATDRDPPEFTIQLNDIDIRIATPEEAAGATMAWTIEDTRADGTAVFVDFENSYNVDFELVCEGSPTVDLDDLPEADEGDTGGGFVLAGAGVGSFTADGESFDGVDVYRCEPFSFGQDPHPDDVDLLAYLGGMSGLNVDVSHGQGFDMSDGSQFEQINLSVYYSRQGSSGVEQFEGSAVNDADGVWYISDPETLEQVELGEDPVVIEGNRVIGELAGLEQTWPDEGAATVDVTFDLEIPTQINEDC